MQSWYRRQISLERIPKWVSFLLPLLSGAMAVYALLNRAWFNAFVYSETAFWLGVLVHQAIALRDHTEWLSIRTLTPPAPLAVPPTPTMVPTLYWLVSPVIAVWPSQSLAA